MNSNRFVTVALLCSSALLFVACGGGGDATTPPTQPPAATAIASIAVLPGALGLTGIGATGTLAVTISPSNATGGISWSSSAPGVATVTATSTGAAVTAVAPGTATIRATSNANPSIQGEATVTVSPVPVSTLSATLSELSLVPGQPQTLVVVARDVAGTVIAAPAITWTTASAAIATVGADGRVTAVAIGNTTITARSGSAVLNVPVTVTDGGYVTAAGGSFAALGGQVRLEVPAGAVTTPTPFTVRAVSTATDNPRVLGGTVIAIEPATAFTVAPRLRIAYPAALAPDVVETQLRLARLVGTAWQEAAVQAVDRAGRLVSATLTGGGTWSVFIPPPSLRGYAQTRNIDIGAAVSADPLRNDAAYARVLAAEFNSVTPENAMKFGPIHPQPATYAFAEADTIVGFAVANGMRVHGHVLLWHSQQPAWLTAATQTRASLLAALKEHIETVVGRYAGRIASWDVANEMFTDDGTGLRRSFWITTVGPDVIDSAFTWARRRDPAAKLYLNDYAVETVNRKSDSLLALASRLKAAGVPIDGVGLQAHYTLPAPTTAQMTANMSRFAAAGFDVRYTELDVRLADGTDNLAAQATAYGGTMDACRAQSRCRAVTTWGITDRYSWIPGAFPGFGRALPFDENFAVKPAYTSLRDALQRP